MASDTGTDSRVDLPQEPDGGRYADASVDGGAQDSGTLTPREQLLTTVPGCAESLQCSGGISCQAEVGNGICVDLDETAKYPGPCAILGRGYEDDYQEGRDEYFLDWCTYLYESGGLQAMDYEGHDYLGEPYRGSGYYEYDTRGDPTRYDYWEYKGIDGFCTAGSFIHSGGAVIHHPPIEVPEACFDWVDARGVRNYESGPGAVYEEASFSLLLLHQCAPVPWWRPLGMLTEFGAAPCVRSQVGDRRVRDYCALPGSPSAVRTREILYDEYRRVLSQLDTDYDGVGAVTGIRGIAFAYDEAGRLEVVQDRSGTTYTYHYDQAGNIVYYTRDDGWLNYSAIYDYSCWR